MRGTELRDVYGSCELTFRIYDNGIVDISLLPVRTGETSI